MTRYTSFLDPHPMILLQEAKLNLVLFLPAQAPPDIQFQVQYICHQFQVQSICHEFDLFKFMTNSGLLLVVEANT